MAAALTELLQEHVVAAMVKQARLRDSIGEGAEGWSVDVPGGWLQLGSREFDVELIGTESRETGAFRWAWADPDSQGDTPAALAVRALGSEREIAELADDSQVPADRLGVFTAAVVTVGVAGLDAYYLAPLDDDGGRLALGIREPGLRVAPPDAASLASTFTNLLAGAPPFGHRRAFAHYLARPLQAVPAASDRGRVTLDAADGTVTVAFDAEGRIAGITADERGGGSGA